jgi:hypothetical protein
MTLILLSVWAYGLSNNASARFRFRIDYLQLSLFSSQAFAANLRARSVLFRSILAAAPSKLFHRRKDGERQKTSAL